MIMLNQQCSTLGLGERKLQKEFIIGVRNYQTHGWRKTKKIKEPRHNQTIATFRFLDEDENEYEIWLYVSSENT